MRPSLWHRGRSEEASDPETQSHARRNPDNGTNAREEFAVAAVAGLTIMSVIVLAREKCLSMGQWSMKIGRKHIEWGHWA